MRTISSTLNRVSWPAVMISATAWLLVCAPFLFTWHAAPPGQVFGGFLFNPMDGHSYLAKIQQGYLGSWTFTLPFTPEPQSGSALFLFYLALGHLARWLGLSALAIFHAARAAAVILLHWSLWKLFSAYIPERPVRVAAYGLALLGSGLGWLGILFGLFSSDYWVAEIYPFLAGYANPHFPAGLALMLWIIRLASEPARARRSLFGWALLAVLNILLAIILPFAWVVGLSILLAAALAGLLQAGGGSWRERVGGLPAMPVLVTALSGGPAILYQYLVILGDPVLAAWNAQNLTPSPGVIDLVVSLSPGLLFAAPGGWVLWRTGGRSAKLWSAWAVVSIVLAFLPFPLQRRFLTGVYIPVSVLGVYGLWALSRGKRSLFRRLVIALFVVSLPTNWIILAGGMQAASVANPSLYYAQEEARAMEWLAENTPPQSVVLAGPEAGLMLPGKTGSRVVYGHPFETIRAEERLRQVEAFFRDGGSGNAGIGDAGGEDKGSEDAVLKKAERMKAALLAADYVYFGPGEKEFGLESLAQHSLLAQLKLVYEVDGVSIWQVLP